MHPRALPAIGVLALLASCAHFEARRPAYLDAEPGWLVAEATPVIQQEGPSDCGAAALAMLLAPTRPVAYAEVRRALGEISENGVEAGRLRDVAREQGVRAYLFEGTVRDLEHELGAGRPVLLGLVERRGRRVYGHYVVVLGLHPGRREVVLGDPRRGFRKASLNELEALWAEAGHLTLVVLPPGA